MNKKNVMLVFGLLLVIMVAAGCASSAKPSEAPKGSPAKVELPKQINITYVKAPLNVPSIIQKKTAMFEKEFEKEGIKITYPEITAGPKQTEALAAGAIDFAHALGGTSAILAAANGIDLKVIGIYSRAPQAFVMLVKNPSIQTVADLKGKKIAGPKGTVLHQLAISALAKNNMKPEDVQYISMDIAGAVAALMNGSIDAAMAAGPAALKASESGARVLLTGEGLVEATIVTAVRGDFLRKHPDLVRRFVKVHKESLDFITKNKKQALELTAAETGLSPAGVEKMFPWYDFDMTVKPSDIDELKRTQEFLVQNGMLTKQIKMEDLILK